jgi:hypothetical protein
MRRKFRGLVVGLVASLILGFIGMFFDAPLWYILIVFIIAFFLGAYAENVSTPKK